MPLFGLLNIHKPAGVTSRRVVDTIQGLVRPAKVGHAGTLDPLASGVLVIGVGQATRLVEYVQMMPKRYSARFVLGCTSTTEDIEGEITPLAGAAPVAREVLEHAASGLVGQISQRPPAYSALKVAGKRAYALARGGQAVDLAPRKVNVFRLEIARYEYPELDLEIECGSGTYVRSLGRDLALTAASGAVMSALVRTAIGHFTLGSSIAPGLLTRENIANHLISPIEAVRGLMPEARVSDQDVVRLGHGLPIELLGSTASECAALDVRGRLVAVLARLDAGDYRAAKFFPDA